MTRPSPHAPARLSATAFVLLAVLWGVAKASAPAPLVAQAAEPASVAVELGGGLSVGKLASAASGLQVEPGPAVSATILVALDPRLLAYAGYARATFGCSEGLCSGADVELGSDGVTVGVEGRWRLLRVFGGVAYHRARSEWAWEDGSPDGRASARADRGWGAEAGAGLVIPVTDRISLAPRLRYLRVRSSFPDSPAEAGADGDVMTHLTLDLGLRVPVPGVAR